jgi:hypothetical protein
VPVALGFTVGGLVGATSVSVGVLVAADDEDDEFTTTIASRKPSTKHNAPINNNILVLGKCFGACGGVELIMGTPN